MFFITAFIPTVVVQNQQTHVEAFRDTVPCNDISQMTEYNNFVKRHVLNKTFDRADKKIWAR